MKIPNVGISQIGVAIPKHFISLEELAKRRKISSEYATKGLGVVQSRIPYRISLEKLATQALRKIDYKNVQRFYIGTESDLDASKPLSVKILNRELKLNIIPFQYKFACLGGLEALISACEYTIANRGKPAIALAVDRSIYRETEAKAEITQGCAAVAMKIEANPKILLLDYQNLGQYALDVDDFKVPASSFPFPIVNNQLTKSTYLACQKKSLEDWKRKNMGFLKNRTVIEAFNFFVMHAPFPKIVQWAAATFWQFEKQNSKNHISLNDCLKNPSLFNEYKKEIDKIRTLPEFKKFFEVKVKPGLKYNPYIGNSYTCSIFVSLISILERAKRGEIIGISGYGSGASSIWLKGISVAKKSLKSDLKSQIKRGEKITIKEYEEWRDSLLWI